MNKYQKPVSTASSLDVVKGNAVQGEFGKQFVAGFKAGARGVSRNVNPRSNSLKVKSVT
jgi:hypothetical protein